MAKTRFLMEKTGAAKYISHLDLMRTVKRAFTRAGVALRHSEGFNPHPIMTFALPLSVGQESVCELLDVDIVGEQPPNLLKAFNAALPDGLCATEVYGPTVKLAGAKWLRIEGLLHYDNGVPRDAVARINAVFGAEVLVIHKKTKRGEGDYDIKESIGNISVSEYNSKTIQMNATISVQNPTLNPNALAEVLANAGKLNESDVDLAPDFAEFKRLEVLGEDGRVFR